MKILVDADACPVKEVVISVGREKNVPVEMIASFNHHIAEVPGIKVIVTDTGQDAADYVIANRVEDQDIVVTQDYGLAALVLGRKGRALSPRGLIFTKENINSLLMQRHISSKLRRGGVKTKGPSAFSREDQNNFLKSLLQLLE
ncbi:MAG: YaiI/YqxD family protein [Dehalobacterium sp.]